MDLIVGIEQNKQEEEILGIILSEIKEKTVVINYQDKVEEYVRSSKPSVVLIAIDPSEKEHLDYVRRLKTHPITRDIPVIALIQKDRVDQNFTLVYKRMGFQDYIVKPLKKVTVENKINEALGSLKDIKPKSGRYVEIERKNKKSIFSFNSHLTKHVLPELKTLLTPPFLKSIQSDFIAIDLRNVPDLPMEEAMILEKLLALFGPKRISLVAGKHMGVLIASTNIQDKAEIFMSMAEFDTYVEKQLDP
jgi:response regulator RpfG family c-di-GMP phosphodiesterase